MSFPKKVPDESKLVTFDFEPEAAAGSLLSNPALSVTQVFGEGSVTDLTVGPPGIDDLMVKVLISAGLDGVRYRIRCEVDADNGEHHIIEKDLPVYESAALVK